MSEVDVDALLEAPYEEPVAEEDREAGRKARRESDGENVPAAKRRRRSVDGDDGSGSDDHSRRRESRDRRSRERDGGRRRDRHRDDEKERDRHRDRDGERDRDRGESSRRRSRDDERRRSRDGDRGHSRDRRSSRERGERRSSRERGERRSSRERRERYGERERERGRDRYADRERYDDRGRRGGGGRYYEDRYRGGRRDFGRGRPGRGANSVGARLSPAEIAERNERTIFAAGLPVRAKKDELMEFFEQAGKVSDIRLVEDRSGRSKGIGYIEYADKACIPQALQLNGMPCKGYPVRVQQTQAEKNDTSASLPVGPTKVSVKNVHPSLLEEDIRDLFEEFGKIESITMQAGEHPDDNGTSMVTFKNPDDAKLAASRINGLDLGGVVLEADLVSRATDNPVGPAATGGMFGRSSDLDDESGIMPMNAAKRALLMQNLGRGVNAPAAPVPNPVPMMMPSAGAPPRAPAAPFKPVTGLASRCILLKNMFNPEEETEPNWDTEIRDETKEEAEKFGTVNHCYVDPNSKGFVYLKFSTATAASEAANKFNGRYFGGNCVEAAFMPEEIYALQFPEAGSGESTK